MNLQQGVVFQSKVLSLLTLYNLQSFILLIQSFKSLAQIDIQAILSYVSEKQRSGPYRD